MDAFGHVNNAVYATYLENARVAHFAQVTGGGLDSLRLIIAEVTITYRSPAHFGETMRVGSRVTEVGNTSWVMEYRVEDRDTGRLVATARSIQVAFDYTAGKPMPVPAEWRRRFEELEGKAPGSFAQA